jgi:regulator of RNase E activity RraA
MERLSSMSAEINLLSRPKNNIMVGTALTVKSRDGDNLLIHRAIDMAGKGDVVVISNDSGGRNRSLAGAIMFNYTKARGVEGMVFDGPIRDMDNVSVMDWHIYATGFTPGGPYKTGPGEINVPISCGGISVNPGDIILGDMDGVIVIPRQDAAAVLKAAIPFAAKDAEKTEEAKQGRASRAWVGELIEKLKFEIIDDVYGK